MALFDRISELIAAVLAVVFVLCLAAAIGVMGGYLTAEIARHKYGRRSLFTDGGLGIIGAGLGFLAFEQAAEWLAPWLQVELMRLNPEVPVAGAMFGAFVLPMAYHIGLKVKEKGRPR